MLNYIREITRWINNFIEYFNREKLLRELLNINKLLHLVGRSVSREKFIFTCMFPLKVAITLVRSSYASINLWSASPPALGIYYFGLPHSIRIVTAKVRVRSGAVRRRSAILAGVWEHRYIYGRGGIISGSWRDYRRVITRRAFERVWSPSPSVVYLIYRARARIYLQLRGNDPLVNYSCARGAGSALALLSLPLAREHITENFIVARTALLLSLPLSLSRIIMTANSAVW